MRLSAPHGAVATVSGVPALGNDRTVSAPHGEVVYQLLRKYGIRGEKRLLKRFLIKRYFYIVRS